MIDILMTHDTTIRFEGPRDRWVVERLRDGQVEKRVEISLQEMADEYWRFRREHPWSDGLQFGWRIHAEQYCLKCLEETVSND